MNNKLVNKLADFLQLEREFRAAESAQSLAFIATNLSSKLLSYTSALLLANNNAAQAAATNTLHASFKVQSVSGTSSFDADAPALRYVSDALNVEQSLQTADAAIELTLNTESDGPSYLLCCPLRCQGAYLGVLALRREHAWLEHEIALANQLAQPLAHAMLVFHQQAQCRRPSLLQWLQKGLQRSRLRWALPALLLLALLPVRQSVIADGQVVAKKPAVIAAGLNGVVKEVLVEPNQQVQSGDLLLRLDPTELVHRRSRVQQELALAAERLRKAEQQAFAVQQGKEVFAELRAEVELKNIELGYVQQLIERLEIRASADGVVLFSSAKDWQGRAVSTGEKVMELADAHDQQFEIWLAVADAIKLEPGAQVKFFPDAFPLRALAGAIQSVGYFASHNSDDVLAYRVTAKVDTLDERVRLGMQGTARLYGDRVILGYYLLRKPLSTLRQTLGL